jgi:CheY-like chemotaxis protein
MRLGSVAAALRCWSSKMIRTDALRWTSCCTWRGWRPVTATNGLEALRLLKSGLPAKAILLDLMMPAMDGWEFRRAQRADPDLANIPVIVLTGIRGCADDRTAR